jgi:hypothetical protein
LLKAHCPHTQIPYLKLPSTSLLSLGIGFLRWEHWCLKSMELKFSLPHPMSSFHHIIHQCHPCQYSNLVGFLSFWFPCFTFQSFSFLTILRTILTSLSSFTRCVIPPCIDGVHCINDVCYIDGSLVTPINWPTLLVSTCIHGPRYEGVPIGCAITIIGCCTHPGGGCHCHCLSTHCCIIDCYIIGYCIIGCCITSAWEMARWFVYKLFFFLSDFVAYEPATSFIATTLGALCTNSPSFSSYIWYSNHVTKEN